MKESYDGSDNSNIGSFDDWTIDSIKKSDGEIVVKGSVECNLGEKEMGFPEKFECNFKARMDKKYNIKSVEFKTDDLSSQISNFKMKIYDIDEADVDLSEIS